MRGVGPLPPPGLEDAALSGDLKHPLQQALLRAAGQKTVSKLAEHAEVKARVRQLEAEQVLPVDPRPDRLSGLPITQALAELHQRDQGQSPGRTGWLTLLGIEVGEVAILEDRPKRVAQGQIGAAFGKGGASDAGGLFGHTWERLLRLERHGETSRDYRSNAALDLPSHLFANGIGPEMGQSGVCETVCAMRGNTGRTTMPIVPPGVFWTQDTAMRPPLLRRVRRTIRAWSEQGCGRHSSPAASARYSARRRPGPRREPPRHCGRSGPTRPAP